jgi:hypothetical protein
LIIAYTSAKHPVEPPSQAAALVKLFESSGPESPIMDVDDFVSQLLPSRNTLLPPANIVNSNNEDDDNTIEKDGVKLERGLEED